MWLSWNKDARDRQSFIEDCQAKMKTIGVNIEIVNGLDVTNAMAQAGQWDLQLYGGYPIVDPDTIRHLHCLRCIGKTPARTMPTRRAASTNGAAPTTRTTATQGFDDLMDAGLARSRTRPQRAALYKQAQDIFLDDVPIHGHYRNATAYAWNSKLTGVVALRRPVPGVPQDRPVAEVRVTLGDT